MLRSIVDPLLSIAFPQQCEVCTARDCSVSGGVACDECWERARIFDGTELLCSKCGILFAEKGEKVDARCHKCDGHAYDKALAAGVYEGPLARCIQALKQRPHLPERLASAIKARLLNSELPSIDVIIPVPLSKRRSLERGFNQASIIAEVVQKTVDAHLDDRTLARKLHTHVHRAGLDDRARELSVKNAFEVLHPKRVAGRSIMLVDDVFTSGATASACAEILKKKGASRVIVFTAARAVWGRDARHYGMS